MKRIPTPRPCRAYRPKNPPFRLILLLWGGLGTLPAAKEEAARAAQDRAVPRIVCPCVADTTIDAAQPSGRNANAGGSDQLRTESNRRYTLLQFDLAQAKDLEITKATLRLRRVQDLLVRAGVSTVAAPWNEGTAKQPQAQAGGACYNFAVYAEQPRDARPWGEPGGDFMDVVFGNGGSRWATVVPRFDKQTFWYEIDVPPAFVQAMLQGLQPGGLCLADDFGRHETSPTFHSRESQFAPELVLEGRRATPADSPPPADLRTARDALGLEWATFAAPHALGFEIYLSDQPLRDAGQLPGARKLEPWAMPAPGAGPRRALLSLYRNSQHRYVAVRALDAAGNWSPLANAELPEPVRENPTFSAPKLPRHDLPAVPDAPFTLDDGPALSLDGKWIRSAAKTWWDPRRGPISLQAGRNEFVAFQVILAGGPGTYRVSLTDWQAPGPALPAPRVQFFKQHYVRSRLGQEKYAPDLAIPMEAGAPLQLDLQPPAASQPASQATTRPASAPASRPAPPHAAQGIWVEIYVPPQTAAGVWRCRALALRDGIALLDIPLELEIVEAALPNTLQFKTGLNTQIAPGALFNAPPDSPAAWDVLRAYHRLAHEHRATLGVTPYAQNGQPHPGFAPRVERDGNTVRLDWSDWDRRFGGYLDGAAFRGLPRDGVPLDHFYLPFHENWPMPFQAKRAPAESPLAGKYHHETTWTEARRGTREGPRRDSYLVWPIEAALDDAYKNGTRAALRQFAEHLAANPWKQTEFLICLRDKYVFTRDTNWWLLSEPEIPDDFRALRFWLDLYRQELKRGGPAPIKLGAQLSNPQLERGLLEGLPDLTAINPTLFDKNSFVLSAPERFGAVWCYGDGILAPEQGWAAVAAWVWMSRLAGARGVLVPQALGREKSWDVADDEAFLYPAARLGRQEPLASLRLKALCRAQQDMEWLELYLAQVRAKNLPEGYGLAIVGQELAARAEARTPRWVTLLPVLRFPGRLDTVAFEEIRRGLRMARP